MGGARNVRKTASLIPKTPKEMAQAAAIAGAVAGGVLHVRSKGEDGPKESEATQAARAAEAAKEDN